MDSVYSYASMASGRSAMSACDHGHVAHNGTTYSGRNMKYVVHCSNYAGLTGADYLTPTQRAQKCINRLKLLLSQAHLDLQHRDSEILRWVLFQLGCIFLFFFYLHITIFYLILAHLD